MSEYQLLGQQNDGEPAVVTPEPPKTDPPETPKAKDEPKTAEGEPEKKVEGEAPKEEEKPHKKPGSVRARERAEKAELEAAETRRENAELKAKMNAPKPAADPNEPQLENFEDLASWRVALAEFHRKAASEETESRFKAEQAKREQEARQTAWREADAKFGADKPDWDDVMEDLGDVVRSFTPQTAPAFQAVDAALSASDIAPALKYHFGQHPDELRRISALDPIRAIKELARIEDRLSGSNPTRETRVSNTPPPITPLPGTSTTVPPKNRRDTYVEIQ
jgi:hypothetical protein